MEWSTPFPGRFAHSGGGCVSPRAGVDGRGKPHPPFGFFLSIVYLYILCPLVTYSSKTTTQTSTPLGEIIFVFSCNTISWYWNQAIDKALLNNHSYLFLCLDCSAFCLFVFTYNTQHKHPCPRRDSNPQFQ